MVLNTRPAHIAMIMKSPKMVAAIQVASGTSAIFVRLADFGPSLGTGGDTAAR